MELKQNKRKNNNRLDNEQLNKVHLEDFGFTIPEDYFSMSKEAILNQTLNEKPTKVVSIFTKNTLFKVAASIVLLLGISIYLQEKNTSIAPSQATIVASEIAKETSAIVQVDSNQGERNTKAVIFQQLARKKPTPTTRIQNENDILVQSLFVEEAEVDQYIENSLLEDI